MDSPKKLSRPQKWVATLGLLVLILGLTNLVRAAVALRLAARLPDLPMTVSWGYLVGTAGFWGLALTGCGVGLICFLPWSRWATLAATSAYVVHIWINRLLFDAADYARQAWPWDLLWTALLLATVWGALNWPSLRKVFQRQHGEVSRT